MAFAARHHESYTVGISCGPYVDKGVDKGLTLHCWWRPNHAHGRAACSIVFVRHSSFAGRHCCSDRSDVDDHVDWIEQRPVVG